MPSYKVVSPIKIGGRIHKPGCADMELTVDEAAGLVKSGSLALVEGGSPGPRPNAADSIAAIRAAATLEELEKLAAGEDRKSVLPAIDARRAELQQG